MNFLFSIISFFFSKQINRVKTISFNDGYSLANKTHSEEYKKSRIIQTKVNYPIGGLFITVCNEWESMTIVQITSYFNDNIPVGIDLVSNEVLTLFCNLVPYSEKALHILKGLNPYERYALVSGSMHYLDREDKNPTNGCEFENELSYESLIAVVERSMVCNKV